MKSESQVLHAIHQFAKTIGAPDALIYGASRAKKSQEVRKYCNAINTTLRVSEEKTPFANKAELYICIIKEAIQKDTKESNCSLAFWDYCMERQSCIKNLTAKDLFSLHGSNTYTSLTCDQLPVSILLYNGDELVNYSFFLIHIIIFAKYVAIISIVHLCSCFTPDTTHPLRSSSSETPCRFFTDTHRFVPVRFFW